MNQPETLIDECELPEAYITACLIRGEWERALDLIAEFGPLPAYAPLLASKAARLLAEGKPEAALRVAYRAVELDPHCAQAHGVVGSVLVAGGIETEVAAEASLRQAVELDPLELPARRALVSLLTERGRLQEAFPYVKAALEIAPSDEATLAALKRLRKAVEAARKASVKGQGDGMGKTGQESEPRIQEQELAGLHTELGRLAAQAHQRRATARPPSVTLCLITRNEARNLPRVIGSVQGLATEVIVVDTGSTDETVKVARRLGAKVDTFTWIDDFAAARNHSLKLATSEWILVLDADDEFDRDSANGLRDWLKHAPAVDVVGLYRCYPYPDRNRDSLSVQPRLFRNGRGLRYRGIIHEQLVTAEGETVSPEVTLSVTHYHHGVDGAGAIARRHARNLPLLLRTLEQDPDDMRATFYVGITHLEREEWSEAVTFLQTVIDRTDPEVDIVRKAYGCLGFAQLKAGEVTAAEATLRQGLEQFREYPELWFGLGLVLDELGRLEAAAAAHEAALRGRFGPSLNWHDWSTREQKPHLALCDLRLCLGDLEAASRHLAAAEQFTGPMAQYQHIRQTIHEAKAEQASQGCERQRRLAQLRESFSAGDREAGTSLVEMLLEDGEITLAREFTAGWLRAEEGPPLAIAAEARVLLAEGAAAEALEMFEAAAERLPDRPDLWRCAARALDAVGRSKEAEQALERAEALEGEDGPAAQALGELYLTQQRWAQAARCFQRRLDRSDQQWEAWLGLGQALLKSGSLPQAIDCYQRAAALSGGHAAVRRALGEARAHLAQFAH